MSSAKDRGGQPRSEARRLVLQAIIDSAERGMQGAELARNTGMPLEQVRMHIRNSVACGEIVGVKMPEVRGMFYVAADGVDLDKQRHLNHRSHSTAHISKASTRNMNLSPDRARLEAFMARIGRPVTVPMLVDRLGIDAVSASACLTRMATQGQVRRLGRDDDNKMQYAWHTYETTTTGNAQREVVRNSNQPNGDVQFWQAFTQAMMTPARRELQG